MAKLNVLRAARRVLTHEGGAAQRVSPEQELRRSVLTCLLWENTFYESGVEIGTRIADLAAQVEPEKVAALAVEARDAMHLRHAPLLLARQLARQAGQRDLVADTLERVIQRPDELAEFLAIYWKEGRQPLTHGVRAGLGRAFGKFDAYQLSKWDKDGAIELRDVLRLVRPKPKDAEQSALWQGVVARSLPAPDTWEVAISAAGKDPEAKRAAWERLLRESRLPGMATLMNLRGMLAAGVDERLVRERLDQGVGKALPFRFVTAARMAPSLEEAIEGAMLKACAALPAFPGKTVLLVDVSGSMVAPLAARGETTRMDAACGLAILLREKAEACAVYTFSDHLAEVPARRGFALRDAVQASQPHSSTYLRRALEVLHRRTRDWDRLLVITDEQAHDGIAAAWLPRSYVVNVAPYQHGVSYGSGWQHVDGFSERILDYVQALEAEG